MPWLYGDGTPIRQPAWVTGRETPTQRDRRLLDINEVLKKKEKRDQEQRNRELLARFDSQADLKFSPPSPPRGPDTPADIDTEINRRVSFQDNFEGLFDSRLESYADRFGNNALFGSTAYVSAERLAFDDLQESMSNKPGTEFDELVGYETVLKTLETSTLIETSRASRVDREGAPVVDSKYDILVDSIKADIAGTVVEGTRGPEIEGAVDEWIVGLEKDIRKDNPGLEDQGVREQLYRTLRIQELLSEVLDEWNWPRDKPTAAVTPTPPLSAIDEAIRREEEENGEFFKDLPDRPGLIEKIGSVFSEKFVPTAALKSLPFTALPLQLSSLADEEFLSLDDIHVIGQETAADPLAGLVLRGEIPIIEPGGPGGARFGAIETGAGLGGSARAGELGFTAITGIETDQVSTALRSQLADDILSEAISPEFIAVALPFAGVGVRGLTGLPKLLRITANLTVGGDVGAARGFPLLRVDKAQSVLRGLTAVARSPLAIRSLPQAVRNNPVFQAGLENLRKAQASVARARGGPAYLQSIGANDPVRFRRVTRDITQELFAGQSNITIAENIPLREAIISDLSSGRSMPDIIENGLTPRPQGLGEAGGGRLGPLRGTEGGERFFTGQSETTRRLGFPRELSPQDDLPGVYLTKSEEVASQFGKVLEVSVPRNLRILAGGSPEWRVLEQAAIDAAGTGEGRKFWSAFGKKIQEAGFDAVDAPTGTRVILDPSIIGKATGEAGGGLIGGAPRPRNLNEARKVWWNGLSTAERKSAIERTSAGTGKFNPKLHDKSYQRVLKSGNINDVDNAFKTEFGPSGKVGIEKVLGPAPEARAVTPDELAFGEREAQFVDDRVPGELRAVDEVTAFWRGEEGGGALDDLFHKLDDPGIVDRALNNVDKGNHPGISLSQLRRSTNNTLGTKLAKEELQLASTSDLITLSQAERKVKGTIGAAKAIRKRLNKGAFPEMSRVMEVPTSTSRRAQGELFRAFDPELSAEVRTESLNKFVTSLEAEAAKTKNLFLRQQHLDDAAYAKFSFEIQNVDNARNPVWIAGMDDTVDMLKTIAKSHVGSPESRLAALPGDTVSEITKDVRKQLRAMGGTLNEVEKKAFTERLLTTRLDIHDATVLGKEDIHFDAGRRLGVLIKSGGHEQSEINNTFRGLRIITEEGGTPSAELLKAMDTTMGPDAVSELLSARKLSVRAREAFMDTIGLPRVLMTTLDNSAALRQGGVLATGHPFIFASALKDSIRTFFSEKAAIRLNESLKLGRGSVKIGDKTEDLFALTERLGLYQAPWDAVGARAALNTREEGYASRFAKLFPGVKMAERTFIIFLNKLRADVADHAIRGWAKSRVPPSENEMRQFIHFVNVATGRGIPGKALGDILPLLNAGLFSPRLALSRFQVVGDTARAFMTPSSRASRLIIKDMTAFVGTNLGVLTLGQLGGLWDVEIDPTKADFLKVRIGNTSIDPWAGFKPYATYIARMQEAIVKGDLDRVPGIIEQLARSKLAPVPSGIWDAITGRDFIGRPVKWNTLDFDNAFINRLTPLIIQDIQEAMEEAENKTLEPIVSGTAAFFGLGTVTYRRLDEELRGARNEVSQAKFGKDYSDKDGPDGEGMNPAARDEVNRDPLVQELDEEVKDDALLRGREWAENADKEEKEILSIRQTGLTLDGTKVTDFTQKQIDDALDRGNIEGNTWIETNRQIKRDIFKWRQGWQEANGIDFESDPPEPGSLSDIIEQWWDVEVPVDPFTLEEDWDTFFAEKERIRALAISMETADNMEVTKYFDALGEDDTEMQMRFQIAREDRDTLLDDTPAYMAGVSDVTVNNLLDDTKDYLLSVGSSWGLARYIQWLYYQDERFQTNEWAIAYWVALGERDQVTNPERDQIVLENPDTVMFYSGLFRGLTDDGRQGFVNRYGTTFLSKNLQETFIETGEITQQTSETQLFRPQPLFQS